MIREYNPAYWKEIYDFVLECGYAHDPNQFAEKIIDHIGNFLAFDCASAYLMDGSGKPCGQHLRNIDERWIKVYLAYYVDTDDSRYSLFKESTRRNIPDNLILNTYDWESEKSSEFVPNFIRVRGIKYSCGFGFYDMHGNLRMAIALDRTQGDNFSEEEMHLLRLIIPQLNNLHKNFFYQGFTSKKAFRQVATETSLTARESQIAEMLCQSISPAEISRTLHIAQSTTYKHIANIYEKMNVSSQRELLARLLSQPD